MISKDIQGKALSDFFRGKQSSPLTLHTSYGEPEEMPVEVFFRDVEDFTELEKISLDHCIGKVLDIGAAGGSFALALQEKGLEVVALEVSPLSCKVMEERGVEKVLCQDLWKYQQEYYDTLLIMMNGIGLAGKLNNVPVMLQHLKQLLTPEGFILVDSSDISYLYSDSEKPDDHYYGEVSFSYEYDGEKGRSFDWVYVDEQRLRLIAEECGFHAELLYKGSLDDFLMKLKVK